MARKRKPTRKPTPKKDWGEKFLTALASYGVVTYAARQAKIDRTVVYDRRDRDPEFARRWKDAIEQATELLEAEAVRRGRLGIAKPVYQSGKLVGHIQEYSDTLLIFLMKAWKPGMYREQQQQQPGGASGVDILAILDRLATLNASQRAEPGTAGQPVPLEAEAGRTGSGVPQSGG